jgi:soluble lytic murein transglycosylase-like protein
MPASTHSLLAIALPLAAAAAPVYAQGVWLREPTRPGGVGAQPSAPTWSTWLRTGPGKAAALRGSTDLVAPRDTSPARFSRYDPIIEQQRGLFGVPAALVRAVIRTESDFDPKVVSSVGAKGLMQLMPDTARSLGVVDPFDPSQNILGGSRYLQRLARRFCATSPGTTSAAIIGSLSCSQADLIRVIAGYHAGPGAVEKYGGLPPYETTRFYVTAVLRRFEQNEREASK